MFMEMKLSWQQQRSRKYFKNSKLTKPIYEIQIHSINAFKIQICKNNLVFYLPNEKKSRPEIYVMILLDGV